MPPCLRRRALCVGIQRYEGDRALLTEVPRAHQDAKNLGKALKAKYNYDVTLLLDDGIGDEPNKANIMDALTKLVTEAKPGDRLFFHYSGHGGQVTNYDGSEEDGFDEVLVPIGAKMEEPGQSKTPKPEWDKDTVIQDDELNKLVTSKLPPGCSLIVVFDCCHSGTAMDLKHERWCASRSPSSEDSGRLLDGQSLCSEPESISDINDETDTSLTSTLSCWSAGNRTLSKDSHSASGSTRTRSTRHMSGSIVLSGEVMGINASQSPTGLRRYRKCRSLVLRGASKDPHEECSDNQPCIFLLAACADDNNAWGGKKKGGLFVNVLLECIKKDYFTQLILKDLLFQTHHLLRSKAKKVAKARPGTKIQELRFSSHTLPDLNSVIPI
ncbi:hypothetical protein M422DRAFT_37705 [Sphaerobolus stellatus SS14]|uniref:Peptidase C14 caspase domain-containing protein n=1 Tax=Sphaerobolus stellatus (strain SS14) TaxID=990650 RepID=A0A0C9U0Q4_SPHS4|nr:hypothetical protein M422DRAFT_37705 [Sphaerobolus stellatus SS14]